YCIAQCRRASGGAVQRSKGNTDSSAKSTEGATKLTVASRAAHSRNRESNGGQKAGARRSAGHRKIFARAGERRSGRRGRRSGRCGRQSARADRTIEAVARER